MAGKKEWSELEIKEFISIYESKPELWDVNNKLYRDKSAKLKTLSEMAEKFDTNVDRISRKINNLRHQFNCELKRCISRKSKLGKIEYIPKWPYFNSLLFLQTVIGRRTPIQNVFITKGDTSIEIKESKDAQDSLESLDNMQIENHQNESMVDREETHNTVKRSMREYEDQYEIFGKFVASEMRHLKSDRLRKRMKIKLQKVILEMNEEDAIISRSNSR